MGPKWGNRIGCENPERRLRRAAVENRRPPPQNGRQIFKVRLLQSGPVPKTANHPPTHWQLGPLTSSCPPTTPPALSAPPLPAQAFCPFTVIFSAAMDGTNVVPHIRLAICRQKKQGKCSGGWARPGVSSAFYRNTLGLLPSRSSRRELQGALLTLPVLCAAALSFSAFRTSLRPGQRPRARPGAQSPPLQQGSEGQRAR